MNWNQACRILMSVAIGLALGLAIALLTRPVVALSTTETCLTAVEEE